MFKKIWNALLKRGDNLNPTTLETEPDLEWLEEPPLKGQPDLEWLEEPPFEGQPAVATKSVQVPKYPGEHKKKGEPKMSKRQRFAIFIARLKDAPAVDSRESALELMKHVMDKVEDEHSGTGRTDFSERMHVWGWGFQWTDLDKDPCCWDDTAGKVHRMQIFNNGRIVITNLKSSGSVVLDKPGAQ
jgi:hypothetical protein